MIKILSPVLVGFTMLSLQAQNIVPESQGLPSGVSVSYGRGALGLKDYYISAEKYTGFMHNFAIAWDKSHQDAHTRIVFDYRYGREIRNHNVSAQVRQFFMRRTNLYLIGTNSLCSREIDLYLGPTTSSFVHLRRQKIASGGAAFITSYSFASLFSLGMSGELLCPVSEKTTMRFGSNLSLLSVGLRIIDMTGESNASPFKFLTPLTGMISSTNLAVDFRLHRRIALNVGYDLFISRITAWDNFWAVSDNLSISMRFEL